MVIGDPGVLGAHVTQAQAKDTDRGLAIIQRPKMEVLPVQGHHQRTRIVSCLIGLTKTMHVHYWQFKLRQGVSIN